MLTNLQNSPPQNGEKSDPESVSRITSPPKVHQFCRLVCRIITPSFSEIGWLLLQNEWQTA